MKFFPTIILIFCGMVFVLLLNSCSNTKYISDKDILLRKNKINIYEPPSKPIKEIIGLRRDAEFAGQLNQQLLLLCKQQPNTKTVDLFKLNLWLYNKGKFHSDSAHFFITKWWDGFRTFLGKHLGEEPVLYDSTVAFSTLQTMKDYLNNKGYLHAKVTYKAKIRHKRAKVTYTVNAGKLYRIDSIYYPIKDNRLGGIINDNIKNTLLHPGIPYDVDLMKQETDRITTDANNKGYYHFLDSYLYFEVDTMTEPGKMDLYLKLVKKPQDTLAYVQYHINNIYVYPDTVTGVTPLSLDTVSPKPHFYIVNGDGLLHSKVLLKVVSFHSGDYFSKAENDYTIERISDLNMFKFINVRYKETGNGQLDCYILLVPAKRQSVQAEFEVNNNTNNPIGNQLSLSYLNKNMFKGADQLHLNLEGGIQLNPSSPLGLVNTIDFNSTANLTFPKFLGPHFIDNWFPTHADPKTDISFTYTYMKRLGYFTLNTGNVSFGWDWHETAFKHHIFNPISISILKIDNKTAPFDTLLALDPLLEKSYSDQLIIGANYTFQWSNQVSTTQRKFSFFRITGEIAGNVLGGLYAATNATFPYKVFNSLPFAQFAKVDFEYRHYMKILHNNYLIFRFAPGLGYAYNNSTELPYTEQFYLGGPSSIRGWQIRSLGPGEYVPPPSGPVTNLLYEDQTADMKIEGNVEYRFDIFEDLKGALFTDFGNIWDVRSDPNRPGAVIALDRFYKEIAVSPGVGVRYDFNYFVIRLDGGVPLYNPGLPLGSRWLTTFRPFNGDWISKYVVFNLAIGYPF